MSDTVGAVIVAVLIILLLGPILIEMAIEGVQAAGEMWADLYRRLRGRDSA